MTLCHVAFVLLIIEAFSIYIVISTIHCSFEIILHVCVCTSQFHICRQGPGSKHFTDCMQVSEHM